jgi:hypothetical protein
MLRGLTGRIIKTVGGEKENQAWTTIKDIENGYITTRAHAIELVKNGDRKAASKLMSEWNKGLSGQIKAFNKKFKGSGIKEKGGLRQSYLFTPQKRKFILIGKKKRQTPLERKLSKRKY